MCTLPRLAYRIDLVGYTHTYFTTEDSTMSHPAYTFEGQTVASIAKISKWTWGAYSADDIKLVTAPSEPKLIAKLSLINAAPEIASEEPKAIKKVAKVKILDAPKTKTVAKLVARDAKAAKAAKPPKGKSIKTLTIELISDGAEDDEIVKAIKAAYPESKFDFSHVSWYRSTLFRDGVIGPEFAPRRSKAYKEYAKSIKPSKAK